MMMISCLQIPQILLSGIGDGDDDIDDDDAKICWFLAYKIHKSCCLWRDGAVQQDLLFYWLYFGDRL